MFSARKPKKASSVDETPGASSTPPPSTSSTPAAEGSLLFAPQALGFPSVDTYRETPRAPSAPFSNRRGDSGNTSPSFRPDNVSVKKSKKHDVYIVSNLPKEITEFRSRGLEKFEPDASQAPRGGLERRAGLAWYLLGTRLFVWKYLESPSNQECKVLTIPDEVLEKDLAGNSGSKSWLIQFSLPLDEKTMFSGKSFPSFLKSSAAKDLETGISSLNIDKPSSMDSLANDAGIVMVHQSTMTVIFWPRIMTGTDSPIILHADDQWPPRGDPSGKDNARLLSGSSALQFPGDATITAMTTIGFPQTLSNFISGNKSLTNESIAESGNAAERDGYCLTKEELAYLSDIQCIVILGCCNGSLWRIDFEGDRTVSKKKLGRDVDSSSMSGASSDPRNSDSLTSIRSITVQLFEDSPQKSLNRNYSNISENSDVQTQGTDVGASRSLSSRHSRSFKERPKEKCNITEIFDKDEGKLRKRLQWRIILLVSTGLEAWDIDFQKDANSSLAWAYNMLLDSDIQKELPGHKKQWLLDMKLNEERDGVSILASSLFNDRMDGPYKNFWFVSLILPPVTSKFFPPFSPLLQPTTVLERRSNSFPHHNFTASAQILPVSPRPTHLSRSSSAFRLNKKRNLVVLKRTMRVDSTMPSLELEIGNFPHLSFLVLAEDGTVSIYIDKAEILQCFQIDSVWEYGKVLAASIVQEVRSLDSRSGVRNQWIFLTETSGIFSIKTRDIEAEAVSVKPFLNEQDSEADNLGGTVPHTHDVGFNILDHAQLTPQREISVADDSHSHAFDENKVLELFDDYKRTSSVTHAYEKLKIFGSFSLDNKENPISCASGELIDLLPSRWTDDLVGNLSGGSISLSISSRLIEKQKNHELFLHFLNICGCLNELKEKQPSVLRIVLEHGEKLNALIQLNKIHTSISQRASFSPQIPPSGDLSAGTQPPNAVWDCITLAGNAIRKSNVAFYEYSNSTLFLSRPSSFPLFFDSISHHATTIVFKRKQFLPHESELNESVSRVGQLVQVSKSVLDAVSEFRKNHERFYTLFTDGEGLSDWSLDSNVLNSLWEICDICIKLWEYSHKSRPDISNQVVQELKVIGGLFLDKMYDHLKVAYRNYSEIEKRNYKSKRTKILDIWYDQIKLKASKIQNNRKELVSFQGERNRESVSSKASDISLASDYSTFIQVAEKHSAYSHLYQALKDSKNESKFHECMLYSVGFEEDDKFADYVFKYHFFNKSHGSLMLFGEKYPVELSKFLSAHPELQWIHEIFIGNCDKVYSSLLRQSVNSDSIKLKKKLLCNAKLAALAEDQADSTKLFRINSELSILNSQEGKSSFPNSNV